MRKHVVIFSSCTYTALGLKALCLASADKPVCRLVSTLDALQQALRLPIATQCICVIRGTTSEMADLLELIIPSYCRRIVLVLQDRPALRKVLAATGFDMVFPARMPMETLQALLKAAAIQLPLRGARLAVFQPKEVAVLSGLLRGQTLCRIARNMGVSYNAVSRYKQLGLRRAGIISLHTTLCEINADG